MASKGVDRFISRADEVRGWRGGAVLWAEATEFAMVGVHARVFCGTNSAALLLVITQLRRAEEDVQHNAFLTATAKWAER
eukprot:CAMPEP_0118883162 /NCGR_PEP_ID=MMETSP1163-20130328/22277_1 /TAXON_ID=124430 /ORGANISM="Phaeomonas parva, Strain CCMP2877" /LENGTH=79 /DNA_ID=CAMNT_0006820477 /DNA_START=27 /DNA_END=263 /DNA_ORIENTATION=-